MLVLLSAISRQVRVMWMTASSRRHAAFKQRESSQCIRADSVSADHSHNRASGHQTSRSQSAGGIRVCRRRRSVLTRLDRRPDFFTLDRVRGHRAAGEDDQECASGGESRDHRRVLRTGSNNVAVVLRITPVSDTRGKSTPRYAAAAAKSNPDWSADRRAGNNRWRETFPFTRAQLPCRPTRRPSACCRTCGGPPWPATPTTGDGQLLAAFVAAPRRGGVRRPGPPARADGPGRLPPGGRRPAPGRGRLPGHVPRPGPAGGRRSVRGTWSGTGCTGSRTGPP